MKKYFLKIKEFIGRYKGEQWFKYTVIIITLLIAAAASEWRKWQESRELPNTEISEEAPENDEPDIIEKNMGRQQSSFYRIRRTDCIAVYSQVQKCCEA